MYLSRYNRSEISLRPREINECEGVLTGLPNWLKYSLRIWMILSSVLLLGYFVMSVLTVNGDVAEISQEVNLDVFEIYSDDNDCQLSQILYVMNRFSEALSPLGQCIEENPDNFQSRLHRAIILTELERYQEAQDDIIYLQELSQDDPQLTEILIQLEDATN